VKEAWSGVALKALFPREIYLKIEPYIYQPHDIIAHGTLTPTLIAGQFERALSCGTVWEL
jgi:hypothetical protein